jgi:hypothetical protein
MRALISAARGGASGCCASQWSPRSASSTSVIGSVPYSSAMPVYSACGAAAWIASHIRPVSSGLVDEPS